MTDHAVSSEAPDPHWLGFGAKRAQMGQPSRPQPPDPERQMVTRAPALGLTTDRPEGSRRGY
jgi:hypothetical protein